MLQSTPFPTPSPTGIFPASALSTRPHCGSPSNWRIAVLVLLGGLITPLISHADSTEFSQLARLDLSELMSVEVTDVGALTTTTLRKTPAAVTRITANDIQSTQARSLAELLEIHVPGVQLINHHWEVSHLGVRGITSDREDKVMIRVNGHVMNERTHHGAITERFMPMLADIQHIDVIRGAGSSLHGLGAVSMVVDITTHDADTQPQSGLQLSLGAGHKFAGFQGHFSKALSEDAKLFVFGGIADVKGASGSVAPLRFGLDAINKITGQPVAAGEDFATHARYGAQHRGLPAVKLHGQISTPRSDSWLRYTRAGMVNPAEIFFSSAPPIGFGFEPERVSHIGYQQLSGHYQFRHQATPRLRLAAELSAGSTDTERTYAYPRDDDNHREDEWLAKLTGNWHLGKHQLALGASYAREKFGIKSPGYGTPKAITARLKETDPWSTNTRSLFAEWQWQASPQLTSFIGGRLDKNTATDSLLSPRAALVWSHTPARVSKLLLTRSQRMNFAEENRLELLEGNDETQPEKLDSLEIRHEFSEGQRQYAISAFYIDLQAIGWDDDADRSVVVGNQQQWGLEFEWQRTFGNTRLQLSHAYTRLIDFELFGENTLITASPFGIGNDLADWSNHQSKLILTHTANNRLSLNSSLRLNWGFPGSRHYRDKLVAEDYQWIGPDWEGGYEESAYLNIGAQYRWTPRTTLNLNAYNLLGVVDKNLNKRNFRDSKGSYWVEAPAIVLNLSTRF